jgi:two-component system, LytTR family, response regulator
MPKIIIIDDEPRWRKTLASVLEEFPDVEIVAECDSADAGIKAIQQHHPELVFLDVEMPGKTGLEMVAEIQHIDFDIIFTTAHDKYSLAAIKASALDYLLKPATAKDVSAALERFRKKKSKEDIVNQVSVLMQHQQRPSADNKIALSTVSGLEFVPISKVVRLEAEINYTTFHLSDKKKITVAKTIKEFEDILEPYNLVRVYKSHVINLSFVKRYIKGDGGTIVLEDGTEIPVSSQRKEELLRRLKTI